MPNHFVVTQDWLENNYDNYHTFVNGQLIHLINFLSYSCQIVLPENLTLDTPYLILQTIENVSTPNVRAGFLRCVKSHKTDDLMLYNVEYFYHPNVWYTDDVLNTVYVPPFHVDGSVSFIVKNNCYVQNLILKPITKI